MQTSHSLPSAQLPLFQEAFWASNGAPLLDDVIDSPSSASIEEPAAFSELSLSGLPGHCLTLLAPILRELSEEQDARWLTLIAPPASLTHEWLRRAGLNRERILLLQAKDNAAALALSCEALRLGRSHTVVSWLEPLSRAARKQLSRAAQLGQAQSLKFVWVEKTAGDSVQCRTRGPSSCSISPSARRPAICTPTLNMALATSTCWPCRKFFASPENSRVTNASSSSARRSTMRPSGISTISRKDVGMTDALYEDATL